MLKIWAGNGYPYGKVIKRVNTYFNIMKEKSWFNDKFNQEMIKDIDNGTVVLKDFALENSIIGGMSPDKLSGGVKTVILMKEFPNEVFDITNCGENCFKWIFKVCENEDRIAVLKYFPEISFLNPFKVEILNPGEIATNTDELSEKTMDYILEDENSKKIREIRELRDRLTNEKIKEFKERGSYEGNCRRNKIKI